ncbi:MAG TPA: UMP kinase, partial [Chitinophagaceae bacterium]|nr:UMP kinase [Chitinophagaceae bacterium]
MLPRYKRILLKLSGESLSNSNSSFDPLDPKIIEQYAKDIKQVTEMG